MSAHELVFCNPPLDHNRPSGGAIVVNAAPHNLLVTLSLELARDPAQPDARVILRGIDTAEPSREHVVEGFDTFPEALLKLFAGENTGKLVLAVEQAA